MKTTMTTVLAAASLAIANGAVASPVTVRAPELPIGATWNVIEVTQPAPGPYATDRWESSTYVCPLMYFRSGRFVRR